MKKLFFSAVAFATLLFAASCQQESLEPVAGDGSVTYTVQMPGSIATKAVGDDLEGQYKLIYEVYRAAEIDVLDAEPLYEGTANFSGKVATVQLQFVKRQDYKVLFWAQSDTLELFNTTDLREVSMNSSWKGNDLATAVFAGTDEVSDCVSAKKGNVTLVRPVSQINIATSNESLTVGGAETNQTSKAITMSTVTVAVKGLHTVYNVWNKDVDGVQNVTFTESEISKLPTDFNSDYKYVAMNYVGFAPVNGTTVDVDFSFVTSEGEIDHQVANVPIKANYRTNILGNLITEENKYTVTIDTQWADNGGNMEFVTDGLVKNLDGVYDVTSAKGLAYAINNLFEEGGNFYLTESVYDLTDFAVLLPDVPAGVTLNLYGEAHVVTRSSVTLGGVTIIGLPATTDGAPALINSVAEGAAVSVSGITLADDNSVLVNENNGSVVVSETVADTIIAEGNDPVAADDVKDLPSLLAALNSDIKVIEITADIEANAYIPICRSVTINGNGNKLMTSATRAFRLTVSNIEVIINNLNVVSSAVVQYPNDVRGISIDASLSNVALTLNDCTIDFTDETTNDWTYAVNVSGNGSGHNVTINGGTYEGANVVNVHSAKNTVKVVGTTLNCLYPANEMYAGACIWVLQNQGSSVYAEGNTFNGSNAIAFNLGTGTVLEEKNNIDNTIRQYKDANGVIHYTVTSTAKLLDAISASPEGDRVINLMNGTYDGDLEITVANLGAAKGNIVVKAAEDATPVITGTVTLGYFEKRVGATQWQGHVTFDGITFDHAEAAAHSLSIQNVEGLELVNCTIIGDGEYGISAPGNNPTGPSSIVNCTFVNAGLQAAGNYATGLIIDNCTFNESCINVQGGNGVTVQNCTFEKTLTTGNLGDSFYVIRSNSTPITVKDCTVAIDSELTEVAAAQENWGVLWNRGTTNWTVENVAVTMTDSAISQTELLLTKLKTTGVINSSNLTVNGKAYASTADELISAVNAGATDIYVNGEFRMPSFGGTANVTITSLGAAIIDNTWGSYWEKATLTFNNVNFKTSTGFANGNGSDYAALYSTNVTYNECNFSGPMRIGRNGAKFVGCTFNDLGNDYIWTYGQAASFENCTFNTDGKALLIYSDGGNGISAVSVTDCVFNATQGAKAGAIANQNCAAIEIHNYGYGVNLTTSGNTADSNFSGEWRIKQYETCNADSKIFVNGTEFTTIALDGKTMTIDSNKNVTVNE